MRHAGASAGRTYFLKEEGRTQQPIHLRAVLSAGCQAFTVDCSDHILNSEVHLSDSNV